MIPEEPLLSLKGIAIVLADGISSSDVSRIASESAVKGFLAGLLLHVRYLVGENVGAARHRGDQFLAARANPAKPISSTTMTKATSARSARWSLNPPRRIFFMSATRASIGLWGNGLEQLTEDHRVVVSSEQSYLGRALGVNQQVEIDYRPLPVEKGDTFVLATDGVYEHVGARFIANTINSGAHDFDGAARTIVEEAFRQGSRDNLTVQVVRIDELPASEASDIIGQRPACRVLPCGKHERSSTAIRSSGKSTAAAAATFISPSIAQTAPWLSSRRLRSTCAATRPICSDSGWKNGSRGASTARMC